MTAVKQRKKKEEPLSKRGRIREYLQGCPDLESVDIKEAARIYGVSSSEMYKLRKAIYDSRKSLDAGRDEMLKETPKELSRRKEPTGKRGRVLEYLRNQPDLADVNAREVALNFGVHVTEVYRARKELRWKAYVGESRPAKQSLAVKEKAVQTVADLNSNGRDNSNTRGAGDDEELIGDLIALNKMGASRVRRAVQILDRLSMELPQ